MKRKIIEIDESLCNGCGQCVPGCAEGAIQIIDGKAKLIADKHCDGLGHCVGHCPTGALKVIEREAEEFTKDNTHKKCGKLVCGCSSNQVKVPGQSPLNNWPIQLSLVPVDAPYLQNADLLIAADCTAFSYVNYHQKILKDKVLLMCCPKLDDAQLYVEKLTNIFIANNIKTLTVAIMKVPCCGGLKDIVKAALGAANKNISFHEVVIDNNTGIAQGVDSK